MMQASNIAVSQPTTNLSGGPAFDPLEMARVVQALGNCSSEMREIALRMSAIVVDPQSSVADRGRASDAMIRSLFPGTTEEILAAYRAMLRISAPPDSPQVKVLPFGDRLLAEMGKRGITSEQLALAAGIGLPSVANILSGRNRPQMTTVLRFAEVLKMPPGELWPGYEVA